VGLADRRFAVAPAEPAGRAGVLGADFLADADGLADAWTDALAGVVAGSMDGAVAEALTWLLAVCLARAELLAGGDPFAGAAAVDALVAAGAAPALRARSPT
jgi:hypothetical protein